MVGRSFVTSDGVRLHAYEAGAASSHRDRTVIAFIPGWCMPASLWSAQLEALGENHPVAALDPRGQGSSDVPTNGFDIDRRADDIAEFLEPYDRVALVGWSLGALEALQYVHRHGDARLERLVLVDSSVGEDPAPPPGSTFIASLRRNGGRDREEAMRGFVRFMFRSARTEDEVERLTQATLRMELDSAIALLPRHLPREHWRELARGFAKPLLYAVTPQFAAQAASLKAARPHTRIAVFEEAGHALFVDEADRFNALLTGFLDD
jgi:microsomal epoxide hydrolase